MIESRKNGTSRRPRCPDRLWEPLRVIPLGVQGLLYTAYNQPRRETDRSPLPNAEVHNALNYTSIPPYKLTTILLTKHSYNFAFDPIKKNLLIRKRRGDIKSPSFELLPTAAILKLSEPFLNHFAMKQQTATQFYTAAFTTSFIEAWNPTIPRTASVQ
jgi:hypothetical protein